MAPKSNRWFAATPNTDYIFKALTDGTVTKLTSGKIPKMTPKQAAGLIGSWVIETGRRGLENLDVVEAGSGRGRGLSQYTGVRRGPYDAAVAAAKAAGQDPNSAQWQIQYFAKEYLNRDLIGWTRVFENAPKNLKSAAEYARYYTGSAAEGTGYFRPGTPHTDRRMQAAEEVLRHYLGKTSAPKGQTQPSQQTFDPIKAIRKTFQPNSAGPGGLSISPVTPRKKFNSTADFLAIKPGDLSGKTRSIDKQVKLPGLYDIANASIGNIGRSSSSYGARAFDSGFNAARINTRSYGTSMDLGRDLSISGSSAGRATTSSGYTWGSTAGASSSWRTGFGL